MFVFLHLTAPQNDYRVSRALIGHQAAVHCVSDRHDQPNNAAIRAARGKKVSAVARTKRTLTHVYSRARARAHTLSHTHIGASTRRRALACTGPLAAREPQSGRSMTTSLSLRPRRVHRRHGKSAFSLALSHSAPRRATGTGERRGNDEDRETRDGERRRDASAPSQSR